MKIVIARANKNIYLNIKNESQEQLEANLNMSITNSFLKNIGTALVAQGEIEEVVEWRFWSHPTKRVHCHGAPLILFETKEGGHVPDLEDHIRSVGEPTFIIAEGMRHVPMLETIFQLCPNSKRLVYPKYSEPWRLEQPELYELCLVDEEWQIDEMKHRHPDLRCGIWDKLVDYQDIFFPIDVRKEYDICYVAGLTFRKNHGLLLRAIARLPDRRLKCICIGEDLKQQRKNLEETARQLDVDVVFSGKLSRTEVNAYVNRSRMGVICSEDDSVPRAMLEYLAANTPVLVNEKLRAGTRYIGHEAGRVQSPETFHLGIEYVLDNLDSFAPRAFLLQHFSKDKVCKKFVQLLNSVTQATE